MPTEENKSILCLASEKNLYCLIRETSNLKIVALFFRNVIIITNLIKKYNKTVTYLIHNTLIMVNMCNELFIYMIHI